MRAKKGKKGVEEERKKKHFSPLPSYLIRFHANFISQQIRSETRFTQVR